MQAHSHFKTKHKGQHNHGNKALLLTILPSPSSLSAEALSGISIAWNGVIVEMLKGGISSLQFGECLPSVLPFQPLLYWILHELNAP